MSAVIYVDGSTDKVCWNPSFSRELLTFTRIVNNNNLVEQSSRLMIPLKSFSVSCTDIIHYFIYRCTLQNIDGKMIRTACRFSSHCWL